MRNIIFSIIKLKKASVIQHIALLFQLSDPLLSEKRDQNLKSTPIKSVCWIQSYQWLPDRIYYMALTECARSPALSVKNVFLKNALFSQKNVNFSPENEIK